MPDAVFETMPSLGNVPQMEGPDLVLKRMMGFIERIGRLEGSVGRISQSNGAKRYRRLNYKATHGDRRAAVFAACKIVLRSPSHGNAGDDSSTV